MTNESRRHFERRNLHILSQVDHDHLRENILSGEHKAV